MKLAVRKLILLVIISYLISLCTNSLVDASDPGSRRAINSSISDIECSLNGRLVDNNECQCDVPWKGTRCHKFDIVPKKRKRKDGTAIPTGAYGYKPNITSWGGSIIPNDDCKTYDMYVSEMTNGCGLNTWITNSRIIHATSDDIEGPYIFQDVSIDVWSHNSAPIRSPSTHITCPKCYYLFHIGSGNHQPSSRHGKEKDCRNDMIHSSSSSSSKTITSLRRHKPWQQQEQQNVVDKRKLSSSLPTSSSSLIHRSASPNGPWEPLPPIPNAGCNNPAPAFDRRNGTLFVLCSSSDIWKTNNPADAKSWVKVTSINLNNSPWTNNSTESKYLHVEDPFLYQDQHYNWHLLAHLYDYRDGYTPSPQQSKSTLSPSRFSSSNPVLVSGHAFSKNLYTWYYSVYEDDSKNDDQKDTGNNDSSSSTIHLSQPFNSWVDYDDGTRQYYATFERPHLVFANGDSAVPILIVHAASPIWDQYDDI